MRVLIPKTLSEALVLLGDNPSLVPIAGGTDIMPILNRGLLRDKDFISLNMLKEEISFISLQDDGSLWIGSLTTMEDLSNSDLVRELFPLISASALSIGSQQIRSLASIGGNIANASPAADIPPALLVHGSSVVLSSTQGTRQIDIEDFFISYRNTARKGSELITAVIIPPLQRGKVFFRKIAGRNSLALSKIVLSGFVAQDRGSQNPVRLAAGSVKEKAVRLKYTEDCFINKGFIEEEIRDCLKKDISPIDDIRSTADYRMEVTFNIIKGFLCK